MKRLLFIIFVFSAILVNGQVKPTNPEFKIEQAPYNKVWGFNKLDSTQWGYSSWSDWQKYFTAKHIQHMIDSLAYEADAPLYEIVVPTSGVTTYTLPWKLRTNSMVFYNGNLLPNSKWNGAGTIYVTISGHIVVKDIIKIKR